MNEKDPDTRFNRRWLRVRDAAEYLGIAPKSVYRGIARRQIPAAKCAGIGVRVDRQALDELLEALGNAPGQFRDKQEGKNYRHE